MNLSIDATVRITAFCMVGVFRVPLRLVLGPQSQPQERKRPFSPSPLWRRPAPGLRAMCLSALNDRKEKGAVRLRRGYSGTLDNQIPL